MTCSDGKRNCGLETEPICIDSLFECPITSILYMPKSQYEASYQQQGYEAIKFGDGENVIATSNANGQPITQIRLEIERPC